MLFPYTYVSHQLERMQEFIDFIFNEVWCNARSNGPFSLDLFDANPDLKEVMTTFNYDHTLGGDFFFGHVERIYGLFAVLTVGQIDQFKLWYQANNDIEKACANDPASQIARYADVRVIHQELSDHLGAFFKGLYSQQLLNLATLRKKIGDINEHNQIFNKANNVGKCPFCGIGDIKGVNHTKREAYDHYLPKALYPFNTINFRNLAPACHECNSTYKLSRDPLNTAAGRRKSFYPYTIPGYRIEVTINLSKADIDHLSDSDVQLIFGPPPLQEEIETWKDVYSIEERYKAKCRSGDAKDWLEQIRIFRDAHGIDPETSLNTMQQQAAISPFANSNFLKKAFLEACQRTGLFDTIADGL